MVLYNTTVYIFSFLLLFPLGFFIARHGITDPLCKQYTTRLFTVCFSVYGLYMLLNYCVLIEDPLLDYWSDYLFFYEWAIDLGKLDYRQIISEAFTEPKLRELPLFACFNGLLVRTLTLTGLPLRDFGIPLMMPIIFLASLIPVFMCKTLHALEFKIKEFGIPLYLFAFATPLFFYSAYFYRDIFIYFTYVVLFYVLLTPRMQFRYLWIALLLFLSWFLRMENGMFACLFVACFCFSKLKRYKLLLLIISGLIALGAFVLFYDTMLATLQRYNERSLSLASNESLGKLFATKIPFPLNYLFLTCFSQLLPFPCTMLLFKELDNTWLQRITVIIPFFWTYILIFIVSNWRFNKIPAHILYLFYASLLYLFLTSIAEINLRRQMYVFPLFFFVYIHLTKDLPAHRKKRCFMITICSLLLLHCLYWGLKSFL